VRLRYHSRRAEDTEREVDPFGMMHREGYWCTAGHCPLRGDIRLFRLDRVLEAEMLAIRLRARWISIPRGVLRAVATTPGDEWSVEVPLEMGAEDARGQSYRRWG
jgi:predicted DNA-binding transcriptional regulator YafY